MSGIHEWAHVAARQETLRREAEQHRRRQRARAAAGARQASARASVAHVLRVIANRLEGRPSRTRAATRRHATSTCL